LSLCCPSNFFFTLTYCWHPGCLLLDWCPIITKSPLCHSVHILAPGSLLSRV
jgi:hypothetical protein